MKTDLGHEPFAAHQPPPSKRAGRWLNRTAPGIGLASLFSDTSQEIASTVMPAFPATMGVAAAWLGLIEGVSDGLSSFAKRASDCPNPHYPSLAARTLAAGRNVPS